MDIDGYKSKRIHFFQKGKMVSFGEPTVPSVVKFLNKIVKNEAGAGRLVEYLIVAMVVLSVVFLVK